MEKRTVKFSLAYRDMWQSAGKYVPRVDQLKKVAPHIIDMGCFGRVETNGGGFEQINLLYGENPNQSIREWTKPFNEAGIQTRMLDRSLNGLRLSPVPADVRKLMYKVKKAQGVDITRIFCGMNDPRNIIDSIGYAKDAGMIAQAALSITYSEKHTVAYYVDLADQVIKAGADEICLKDMAGIGRPVWLGQIVRGIKEKYPDMPIQYHSHAGPGFAMASVLEVVKAGVEYVDVGMEPLSWGTGHVDLLAVREMLKDAGYDVPKINMEAYMKVRRLSESFMEDFLGYFISPTNRHMNSLLISSGLPGGMMGSLMPDLESSLESINKWLRKNDRPEITLDQLMIKLFKEVEYIWPMVGYPPLVTPFSQYVKNLALMNVVSCLKGGERWKMIPDNVWDMLTGKAGKLPGKLAPELVELAEKENKEFFKGHPQDLVPDQLDKFRKEMDDNGWDYGEADEELFELAMHPEQYRNYKSGAAKLAFEKELKKRKAEGGGLYPRHKAADSTQPQAAAAPMPSTMNVEVNGEMYKVNISYENQSATTPPANSPVKKPNPLPETEHAKEVTAPLSGTFYFTKESGEKAVQPGDHVTQGDVLCYIEAMKTYNAIKSEYSGEVVKIVPPNGASVDEDDVLFLIR